jgi:deoxyribodipyrimidine photo-lyase
MVRTFEEAVLASAEPAVRPGVEHPLSLHLHFGEIGPRQIWRTLTAHATVEAGDQTGVGVATFLSDIAWREFSYRLLFPFLTRPTEPLRQEFRASFLGRLSGT